MDTSMHLPAQPATRGRRPLVLGCIRLLVLGDLTPTRRDRKEGVNDGFLDAMITPDNAAPVLMDQQAGLAFAVQSIARHVLLNSTVAVVRIASAF
jgi:hypothetical protein